jgi:cytochrome c-type biogenesis protein CcmE
MRRRYTFWVVTVFGGLGLLFGLVQIALTAAQVFYVIPAHVPAAATQTL